MRVANLGGGKWERDLKRQAEGACSVMRYPGLLFFHSLLSNHGLEREQLVSVPPGHTAKLLGLWCFSHRMTIATSRE
jgi:hypothetical protein